MKAFHWQNTQKDFISPVKTVAQKQGTMLKLSHLDLIRSKTQRWSSRLGNNIQLLNRAPASNPQQLQQLGATVLLLSRLHDEHSEQQEELTG